MILITGATGRSSGMIVREFIRQKKRIRVLVRNRFEAKEFENNSLVELVEGNIANRESLGIALDKVDKVLLISSPRGNMLEAQCLFIDSAKSAGVPHIVKFSGAESGIGFDPNRFIGTRQHEDIEKYLEQSGLSWTHLRPSQFMQVYLDEVPSITETGELRRPMGESQLAPVDLEDVAKIAVALLLQEGHQGKSYNVTGPEALTMREVADRLSEASNQLIRYVDISPDEHASALKSAGTPGPFVELLKGLYAERRRCLRSDVKVNTHEVFGVRPTAFLDFARKHRNAWTHRSNESGL